MEQGRVAACHALDLGFKEKLDPLAVSAVYSVPELAGVGFTEDNAKEQGIHYEVGRCNFGEIPRGLISGDSDGMLKLIFRRHDRRLLGVHILGDIASELIALGQATLHNSGTIDVFNNLTFATPTYTMAYKYAAFDGFKRLAAGGCPRPLDLNINEILLNFSKLKNRPYQLVVKTTNLTLNFLENLLHYKNYLVL